MNYELGKRERTGREVTICEKTEREGSERERKGMEWKAKKKGNLKEWDGLEINKIERYVKEEKRISRQEIELRRIKKGKRNIRCNPFQA